MRFLIELWGHRRDLGALWWRGLGRLGLSKERFQSLPAWQRRAGKVALGGVIAFLLSIAVTFPYWWNHMFTIPIFGQFPSVETAVYMVVFIMMAVGLNIVVGYAGLLDLGYVAFYAMGAYTTAWFASLQFPQTTLHFA